MVAEDTLKDRFMATYEPQAGAEAMWRYLKDRFYVTEACEMPDMRSALGHLGEAAQGLKELAHQIVGSRMPPGRAGPYQAPFAVVPLRPDERRRAGAVARFIEKEAAGHPAVRAFRQAVLGEPLSDDEADAFVRSPASARLRPDAFRALNILDPGRGVTLESSEERRAGNTWEGYSTLFVDPPGVAVPVHRSAPLAAPVHVPPPALEWLGRDGRLTRVPYWPTSVLHELDKVSVDLARRFPWRPSEAARFVLTGEPGVQAVQVWTETVGEDYARGVITIEVAPWVTPETVAATYRQFQDAMLGGHDNRPPTPKGLDVFDFVEERREAGDERPNLRQMARLWNAHHPDRAYRHLHKLGEIYRRTRDALLRPTYEVAAYAEGRPMSALHDAAGGQPGRVRWDTGGYDPGDAQGPDEAARPTPDRADRALQDSGL